MQKDRTVSLHGVIYEVEVAIGISTTFTARGALSEREDSGLKWCVTAYDAARNKRSDCAKLLTVSCAQAKKQLSKANQAVKKAKRRLKRAKSGEIRKAKKKLKRAKRKQQQKRAAKKLVCGQQRRPASG